MSFYKNIGQKKQYSRKIVFKKRRVVHSLSKPGQKNQDFYKRRLLKRISAVQLNLPISRVLGVGVVPLQIGTMSVQNSAEKRGVNVEGIAVCAESLEREKGEGL